MPLPEPIGTPIHRRSYDVQAYRVDADRLRLRGTVHDEKPPGIYIVDDTEPLSIHHMEVDLVLEFPSLLIVEAAVAMNVTPHLNCNTIEPDYQQLVGLSIARGFSRKVKDLFGGPSGCTHVGALLQAMAPVAIQSSWSMRTLATREQPETESLDDSVENRKRALMFNLNTCHIWDEDGPQVASAIAGEDMEVPIWARERLVSLGRSPDEWMRSE